MFGLSDLITSYVLESSYHRDIRDVAKSVNSSLIQLVKPEDGTSLSNLMSPATGSVILLAIRRHLPQVVLFS